LSLAAATLSNPIAPHELEAAFLSPEGVAATRALFERSVAEGLELDGALVTPELGGEATLDGGTLVLVSYPDPIHPLLREMVRLENDPPRLLAVLQSSADGKKLLKETGGLHALLYMLTERPQTDEQQRTILRKVVASAVATHFKTWTVDPETQKQMIEKTDWRGRYVGFWHIHPPRLRPDGLAVGIEPSTTDMTNAAELGQFLTIVFQPDGFDVFDLSPLARRGTPDLTRARVFRYRSPEWGAHFQALVRARLRS
jgi:hypothetical protein